MGDSKAPTGEGMAPLTETASKPLPFKQAHFLHSGIGRSGSWQEEQDLEEPETDSCFRKGIAMATK
ncbi:unnamed protein product [Staurois parvus]|uniref:Uncharacterized protein n=1 Tax=Staurois parvus TaxID=386267 RepID=A0ABN9BYU1_9NEOB|nr:unnamed protein product [Staurois parvus]